MIVSFRQFAFPREVYLHPSVIDYKFVAIDLTPHLGYYVSHYLMHKVPLLWHFHKTPFRRAMESLRWRKPVPLIVPLQTAGETLTRE